METNQDEKFCSHCSACGAATGCGASLEKPRHALTRILAETLVEAIKIVNARGENHYTLKELEEAGVSYSARNNHQKLRYFGLIAHVRDENDKPIRGSWLITSRGGAFLRGEEAVHSWIRTFRNKIDERSPDHLYIRTVLKGSDYLETYEDFVRNSTIATDGDKSRALEQRTGTKPEPVAPAPEPVFEGDQATLFGAPRRELS